MEVNKTLSIRLGPFDVLSDGTKVAIENRCLHGKVKGHRVAPNGVVVHTVLCDSQYVFAKAKWVKFSPPKVWEGNYSFVLRLERP